MNEPLITVSKIKDDVLFGKNVKIVEPVNLYGCNIGDDCFRAFYRNSKKCNNWSSLQNTKP
ncbi:MAG: hypothetical protein R2765_08260 [Ferruginibacter sp.]